MLTGQKPPPVTTRAMDASLTLYAEHELNASTFTTRVIAATLSDMHSAVAGGVGALKGTLHGGAGEAVMRTLLEIGARRPGGRLHGQGARARSGGSWASATASTPRGDPRAAVLKGLAEAACAAVRPARSGTTSRSSSTRACRATKKLIPNVDFYSAPLFYSIGIPVDLFTPVIAAGRIAGWTANLLEQYDDNRLIRPRADYKGAARRAFVPLDKR